MLTFSSNRPPFPDAYMKNGCAHANASSPRGAMTCVKRIVTHKTSAPRIQHHHPTTYVRACTFACDCTHTRLRLTPLFYVNLMGAESGGGGTGGHFPRSQELSGATSPQKSIYFSNFFLDTRFFCIFQHFQNKVAEHFQNKVAEIRGETEFWCRWDWVPMHPSPQAKLRGGAFGQLQQARAAKNNNFERPLTSSTTFKPGV